MGHYRSNSFTGEWVEIIIRDGSGRKLETFKFNVNDKAMASKIIELVVNKYNIKLGIIKVGKDLDWLKYDTDF